MLNSWPFQVRFFLSNHKESMGKFCFLLAAQYCDQNCFELSPIEIKECGQRGI